MIKNWVGFYTLSSREIMRFFSVWRQTIIPGIVTTLLYIFVFGVALENRITEIGGVLNDDSTTFDIIKAMMPGGSVIGCPKINTLNLLNHQEKDNRNIYTGSFGYIKTNGDMRFNIIIRSLLNYKNISEISVASGVILGSESKKEYAENYIKAKSLLDIFKS